MNLYQLKASLVLAVLLCNACRAFKVARNGMFKPLRPSNGARELWIQNSLSYYDTITRGSTEYVRSNPYYLRIAMENYFAREKIKDGKAHHAETIYRRLVDELTPLAEDECHLSSLAVPTLLLGLLLQREERYNDARSVFEAFSHVLSSTVGHSHDCCCSARVLQAHALFEMKHGEPRKAVKLAKSAIRMDKNLRPVLRWQQFQEAMSLESNPAYGRQ